MPPGDETSGWSAPTARSLFRCAALGYGSVTRVMLRGQLGQLAPGGADPLDERRQEEDQAGRADERRDRDPDDRQRDADRVEDRQQAGLGHVHLLADRRGVHVGPGHQAVYTAAAT